MPLDAKAAEGSLLRQRPELAELVAQRDLGWAD